MQRHRQSQAHDGADATVLVEDVHHAQARRRLALHHDVAAVVGQGRLHAQPQLPLVRLDQQLGRAGDQFHARVRMVEPEHQRVAHQQDGGLVQLDFIARCRRIILFERCDAARRAGVLRREEIDVARLFGQAFEAHGAALAPATARVAFLLAHFHGRQAKARVERHQPHEARDAADGFGRCVLLQVDQRAQLALPRFLALEPRRHVRQAVLRPL